MIYFSVMIVNKTIMQLHRLVNKTFLICLILLSVSLSVFSKEKASRSEYVEDTKPVFKNKIELTATTVKDQFNSGTCWSFSTISMLESELVRFGHEPVDLSEMFIVRNAYANKAERYIRMHGKINFGSGGAFNDVTDVISEFGIVPEKAYRGLITDSLKIDHSEMDLVLKEFLNAILETPNKSLSPVWEMGFDNLLNSYLGTSPELFAYNGEMYTPQGFSRELDIHPEDYVLLSSFTHHPYYEPFILEVPDNWSWGKAYNLTLDELEEVADNALKNKITFVWASDVSEEGFDFNKGLAVAPEFLYEPMDTKEYRSWKKLSEQERKDSIFNIKNNIKEVEVTAELRQKGFDNQTTTDDHGMHVTGLAYDDNGKKYYYVKNSWGTGNPYDGYLYVSEAYFRLKTISIMVHKDAIPNAIKKKLNLN